MTLKEQIERDGVAMRWVRTAATTVTALSAAMVITYSAVSWVFAPRFDLWATSLIQRATEDIRTESQRRGRNLDRLDNAVAELEENVGRLSLALQGSLAPSWRFSLPDTSISDGRIGGVVTITAAGYKLRECGVPRVDLYFINGGGIYHRFEDASLLSVDGRGVAFPVNPDRLQRISYTATIPEGDGVRAGRGRGFIAVTYPDTCPSVEEVIAGPLQFRIEPQES